MGNRQGLKAEQIKRRIIDSGQDLLYLFGVDHEGQGEVIVFDARNEQFFESRPPEGMRILDHMSAVKVSNQLIYLSGGITKSKNEISDDLIEYNPLSNSFCYLLRMKHSRYTHCLTFKEGKIYALGGRTYGEGMNGLLRSCELYDTITRTWKDIAPLSLPRCTFFTFQYKQAIYVCGGGNRIRTEKIERYNEIQDEWEVIEMQLNRGIECGSLHLLEDSKDEFVIFGGNQNEGGTNECWKHNLVLKTSELLGSLTNKRVLQKSILASTQQIYIIGGDREELNPINNAHIGESQQKQCIHIQTIEKSNFEKYNISFSQLNSSQINEFFLKRPYQNWKSYSQAHEIQIIKSNEQQLNNQQIICKNLDSGKRRNSFTTHANTLLKTIFRYDNKLVRKSDDLQIEDAVLHKNSQSFMEIEGDDDVERKIPVRIAEDQNNYKKDHNDKRETPFGMKYYLFGTSEKQEFILEIDVLRQQLQRKIRPRKLRLLSYRCGVRVEENESIFLCGGVNDEMSKISNVTYMYFPEEDRVELLRGMHQKRYTFCCVRKGSFIYALGGRSFGSDDVAIMSKCERYNMWTKQWEHIASMHQKRCSFMASCHQNMLYVTGGYGGNTQRHSSFECYHEREDRWELMTLQLAHPLEAAILLPLVAHDHQKILVLGGRIEQEDSDQVYAFDFIHGFDASRAILAARMPAQRCLHKLIPLSQDSQQFLILGGFTKGPPISAFAFNPLTNSFQILHSFNALITSLDTFLSKEIHTKDLTLRRNLVV